MRPEKFAVLLRRLEGTATIRTLPSRSEKSLRANPSVLPKAARVAVSINAAGVGPHRRAMLARPVGTGPDAVRAFHVPLPTPPMRRLLVFALVSFAACGPDAPERPVVGPPVSQRVEPQFREDGTLSFLRGSDTLRTIRIEIADTDSTRTRGLMERSTIPPDTGMLFIFPAETPQGFWMANTPYPLDIQYYRADSTLVSIAADTTPFSQETLPSDGPAQFVVEVAAGVSRRIGLVPGDRITWTDSRAARPVAVR